MSVKIANRHHLKQFINQHIGKVLPLDVAAQMKVDIGCIDITPKMYSKIMTQYNKVKATQPKLKLDGGFSKKGKKSKKSKKRRKSNKRRTKKNQKGGFLDEIVIYSFGFVSLISIALFVIVSPFILVKDCLDKREADAQNQYSLEQRQRRWREDDLRAMNQSPPRRRGPNHLRAIKAFQKDGGSEFGDLSAAEAADRLMGEGITEASASYTRDN